MTTTKHDKEALALYSFALVAGLALAETGVKKRDRRILADYLRAIADEMGLRDWDVRLEDEPCEPGNAATCKLTFGRKLAKVYVEKDFRSAQTPEEQRDTIVHELVHCHFESMASMVRCDLERVLGRPMDDVFFNGFERQFEYGVDAVAVAGALARHLPLISWEESPSVASCGSCSCTPSKASTSRGSADGPGACRAP